MSLLKRALECTKGSIDAKTAWFLFLDGKDKLVTQDGLSVWIHYFNTKYYTHHEPIASHKTNDPLLPPYPKNREVAKLVNGADHYLFINRGMVCPGHTIISSASPKAIQGDPLNMQDCHALEQVVTGYKNKGIAYYNSGVMSGCSQMHKHMQFAPWTDSPLFEAMKKGADLPWRYVKAELKEIRAEDIMKAYTELKRKMNWDQSYNFVMSDGVIALVPRRQANHPWGVNINSLGVAGHFFIWEHSDKIIEQQPIQVLKDLCVPRQ